jgi:hypothetical protein
MCDDAFSGCVFSKWRQYAWSRCAPGSRNAGTLEIAMEYLKCFCEGDIAGLEPLFAPDMKFTGTLCTYHSRAEYIKSLRNDTPEKCGYKVLSVNENDDSVAVFYEYQKPQRTMQIAQLFKFKNEKIHEVLLVFDGRGFA